MKKISPIIIKSIERIENKDKIYKYIYENVIKVCNHEILNNNYDLAYSKYKNTIMQLEQELKMQSLRQTIKK